MEKRRMGHGGFIYSVKEDNLLNMHLQAFGALTPQTVLDYFAQSPFYDPTSNNAVLRMQTQYSVAA
jgi:hypothetical protein